MDELGQMLLSLRIELSLLQVSSNGIHPAVHQKSTAMIVTLDLALRSLRAVVSQLRPLPPGEGLDAALARLLAEFTDNSGIAHYFDAAPLPVGAPGTGPDEDALLYRVLQEALADVARQASATEVHVCLDRGGERLSLRLDDNGVVAPDGRSMACGCGIESLRERIDALGGQLRMSNTPGAGNALLLSLPAPRGLVAG
ncbi:hypothetical protein G4G28_12445 [Massilia sp. Dwa41.01b]|uniref:sensor histidine kinase n=1 Tax=Massilia sp. Dwa41.01b TaxID=2709302 RepID=UPI00160129CC|nr:histidine kinase [Massilia sp. Dwa41.01b]QNA89081.1 hypothetical protein G4G28_12445 [Massilia sp. Dwa41.01b]